MPADAPDRPARTEGPAEPSAEPIATVRRLVLPGPGLDERVKPGAALALRNEPAAEPRTATPQEQLEAFAKDLRELRTQAGLGYPEMAELSHYTMKTLASAAGGLNLPTLPVIMAYVKACEGTVSEWEDRWHRLADAMKSAADAQAPGTPDRRNAVDGSDARDEQDLRDQQGGSGARDGRDPRDQQEKSGSRDEPDGRGAQGRPEGRDPRDPRDPRGGRDARDPRSGRDPRDPRGGRNPRDLRGGRDARDPRNGRDGRDPRGGRNERDPASGPDARDPSNGPDVGGPGRPEQPAAWPSQVSSPPSAPGGGPDRPAAEQAAPADPSDQVYVITSAAPRRPHR